MSTARLGTVLAFALVFPGVLGCNSVTSGGSSDDPDGGIADPSDPCVANPNYSTLCWKDGAFNGSTKNAACPAVTPTIISGTVTIPAGTLPLVNANVYIAPEPAPDDPLAPTNLPPITHGATCDTCDKIVPLNAVGSAVTDVNGYFSLSGVPLPPDGKAMYLVIRAGKWRRSVRLENDRSTNSKATKINHCATTMLPASATRMPRNKTEGDIPRIALSTGSSDALECILRGSKLGLDDSEFSTETGTGSVNLYTGNGTAKFDASLGGATFTAAQAVPTPSWWDTQANWDKYDAVMLSCEGGTNLGSKSVTARANLQNYINAGGRVFASHWHYGWMQGGPAPLSTVGTFITGNSSPSFGMVNEDIVTSFKKGADLQTWLGNAMHLTPTKQLPIKDGRQTLLTLNSQVTQSWVTYQNGANLLSQYFSFFAPIGAPPAQQCGQMVFTDLHVSATAGGDTSGAAISFPKGCTTTGLSPQEAALIYLFFDLTGCVQPVIG